MYLLDELIALALICRIKSVLSTKDSYNVACVTHASRMRGMTCGDQVFVGVGDAL
jgi:hypothetical protein